MRAQMLAQKADSGSEWLRARCLRRSLLRIQFVNWTFVDQRSNILKEGKILDNIPSDTTIPPLQRHLPYRRDRICKARLQTQPELLDRHLPVDFAHILQYALQRRYRCSAFGAHKGLRDRREDDGSVARVGAELEDDGNDSIGAAEGWEKVEGSKIKR
jgi:hypothetical protein